MVQNKLTWNEEINIDAYYWISKFCVRRKLEGRVFCVKGKQNLVYCISINTDTLWWLNNGVATVAPPMDWRWAIAIRWVQEMRPQSFQPQLLLYVPAALVFRYSMFVHGVQPCFVWVRNQRDISSLHRIKWLILIIGVPVTYTTSK